MLFTVSCLAPSVPLSGYCEVSIIYGLAAGSLLLNKTWQLPWLSTAVSLGIQLEPRQRAEPCARVGTERQGEREHCCSVGARSSFQSSSKGHFARVWAGWHRSSKGANVEESAEHSPASGVALCSFCIATTMSNPPFDKLNIRKCQSFLPPPWFSVTWGMKMSKDETGTRRVLAPFKVSDKGPSLLEVWLCLLSKPPVLHIILMCLAVLGFLGNRNMDMCQTHTAEYVWLTFGWYATHNLMQSMGAKPVL